MADRKNTPPKYRHYKPKNLAVVRINGRDHYLGSYDSPESREKYGKLIAEWYTTGRVGTADPQSGDSQHSDAMTSAAITISELILAYLRYCETYYRDPNGERSLEIANIKYALKPVRKLYGSTPAQLFGPLALQAVRNDMIRSGLARPTVNARIHRVRRAFRWAASLEMVPGSLVHALDTVDSLKQGRTVAPEPEDVTPVPFEHIEGVLPLLSQPVAAMVKIQLFTGCRVGEVLAMRRSDIVVGSPNWEYRPRRHKNAWRGHTRIIPIGPKAQAVLAEFLNREPNAFLFDPREAVAAHHARRATTRTTKPTRSELSRRVDNPGSQHASRYNRRTYRQAVVRACRKANVPDWSPLQLRHTAATLIRSKYGLEAASNVLGHSKPDTTLIYAERDLAKAHVVAAEIG